MAKISKIRKFRDLEFWAEGGCVVLVDNRDGQQHTTILPVRDWLERLLALNKSNTREKWPDERVELQTCIDEGVLVAREAKAQGDPLDPKVIAHRANARRRHFLAPVGAAV